MAEKKTSILILLEILQEETDENHILTRREILEKAREKYGIELNRRTFYSNLDMLEEFGYEVSRPDVNRKGYYLITRKFEMSEVLMMCNALHASNFISARSSNEMIRKLLSTQSLYERQTFSDSVYLPNRKKTENQELLLNIEIISDAVRRGRPVSFTYLTYSAKGKLVARRREPYVYEPRFIVYNDGRGYVVCTSCRHEGFSHFRLDRMKDVSILEEEKVRRLSRKMDPYFYTRNKLFMFAGDNISADLLCRENILSQMIDLFGPEQKITMREDGSFEMTVSAPKQGILWLVQEYLDSIIILAPQSLRNEHAEILRKALSAYEAVDFPDQND